MKSSQHIQHIDFYLGLAVFIVIDILLCIYLRNCIVQRSCDLLSVSQTYLQLPDLQFSDTHWRPQA